MLLVIFLFSISFVWIELKTRDLRGYERSYVRLVKYFHGTRKHGKCTGLTVTVFERRARASEGEIQRGGLKVGKYRFTSSQLHQSYNYYDGGSRYRNRSISEFLNSERLNCSLELRPPRSVHRRTPHA